MHDSEKQMIILDLVGSTNNYAMGLIKNSEAADGISVFAIDQTEGKGRLGRQWISEPGANVHLSIITQMQWASLHNQFFLSMAAALSIVQLVEKICPSQVFVKWPNDIIINDRKAAGILIENVISGHIWQWAVTGIGLNVNQKEFFTGKATSLFNECHQEFDVLQLAADLKEIFLSLIAEWQEGRHFLWIERYNSRLYKSGQSIKLEYGNRIFETKILGVTKEGRLRTKDIFEREWDLDQVKIRIPD